MSMRENIVAEIYTRLKLQRGVKLGVVERDPIIPEELPRTGFPAVSIESTNESRTDIAYTMSSILRESNMEVELVIYVQGKDRDRQRNTIADAIETSLTQDGTLNKKAKDIRLSRIEAVQTGEAKPYASLRMVFEVNYCYEIN